jgi:hypothetical protein
MAVINPNRIPNPNPNHKAEGTPTDLDWRMVRQIKRQIHVGRQQTCGELKRIPELLPGDGRSLVQSKGLAMVDGVVCDVTSK